MKSDLSAGSDFGQYRIVRLLGRGGMGEVYEAEHRVLHRRYALKLLPEDFATRSEAVRRFEREAEVMANLEHAHIVRVDEFGETNGRYWLRMELVKGVAPEAGGRWSGGSSQTRCITLGDYAAQRGGKLEQGEFAIILKQVLEALAYAHGKGVVHRDLKPGNILLEKDAAGVLHVKVSDFGLARVIGEEFIRSQAQISVSRSFAPMPGREMSLGDQPTLRPEEGTSTRALLGTWEYMSPEQKRGEEADARSDVYAVGLICYRLLTGGELGVRLPSQLDKTLNPAWDEFVGKALDPKSASRYGSGREMLEVFNRYNWTESEATGAGPEKVEALPKPARLSPKSKRPWVVATVVALLLLGAGGWYFGLHLPEQRRKAEAEQQERARLAEQEQQQKQLAEARAKAEEAERQRKTAEEKARQEEEARLALEQQKKLAEATARAEEAERQRKAAEGKALQAEAARLALEKQKQEAEHQRQLNIADGIKSAQAALQNGKYADARQQYQVVLAMDDGNAQAKTGLADVDKAEKAAAALAAFVATNNIVPAKKFAGTWTGSVDYKNILIGGNQSCTVVINHEETLATETLGKGKSDAARKTTVNGNTISWKPGWFHEEIFTMAVTDDGQTASVSLTSPLGTGYGTLKKQ